MVPDYLLRTICKQYFVLSASTRLSCCAGNPKRPRGWSYGFALGVALSALVACNSAQPQTASFSGTSGLVAGFSEAKLEAAYAQPVNKSVLNQVLHGLGAMTPKQFAVWLADTPSYGSLMIGGADLGPATQKVAHGAAALGGVNQSGATMAKVWAAAGVKWSVPSFGQYTADLRAVAAWGNSSDPVGASSGATVRRASLGLTSAGDCAMQYALPNASSCPYEQQILKCAGAIIGSLAVAAAGGALGPAVGTAVAGALGSEAGAATTGAVVGTILPTEVGGSTASVSAGSVGGWAASTAVGSIAVPAAQSAIKSGGGCSADLVDKQVLCAYGSYDNFAKAFNCPTDSSDQEIAMAEME